MKDEEPRNIVEDINTSKNKEQNQQKGYWGEYSRSHSHSSSHSHYSNYSNENISSNEKNQMRIQEEKKMININNSNQESKEIKKNLPKQDLDFLIFLSVNLKKTLTEKKILERISKDIGEITMEFDESFIIPSYSGVLLKIKGKNIIKKRNATQELLELIVNKDLDREQSKVNSPKEKTNKAESKIQIVIMIPNGLVSMVIGTRGKQISTLINDTYANIVINQPIYKMSYRTVSISGTPKNISDAIMSIQKIMEERYNEVQTIEFECKPLNVRTSNTNVKLVIDERIAKVLTVKNKHFADNLKDQFNVIMKIYHDRKNRHLDKKDLICSLQGTIQLVQNALIEVLKVIKNDIKNFIEEKKVYSIKMLINKVFVTKLIGAKGCMIQEISNFAKGASIKIMSNKYDEKKNTCHDIPVCIGGGFDSIQNASCIIIEQMECFKNGGPILKTGEFLHDNIAKQFVNSIFTDASKNENEDDHIYTLKDKFLAEKREREKEEKSNLENMNYPQNPLNNNSNNINIPNNNTDIMDRENNRSLSNNSYDKENNNSHHHHYISNSSQHDDYDRMMKRSHHNSSNFGKYNDSRSHSRNHSYKKMHSHNNRKYSHNSHNNNYNSSHSDYNNSNNNINRMYKPNDLNKDYSYEEKGEMKISINIIVPDHLVNILIGKRGENVKSIMSQTGSIITFSKEYNDDCKIHTSNGVGRICNLKGTPQQNSLAMQKISKIIINYEQNKNNSITKNDYLK